jgi:DNA-binding beta-propeller fold protein YncE
MRCGRFLLITLLFCFACASYGVQKNTDQKELVSPGLVKGLKPIEVIGETRLGTSFLSFPTGIAVDFLGNIFIADTGNDRVVKCDPEGRFLKEAGGFGWDPGQFNRPTYVTTDNGLNVYVVDAQNKRIQRFDHNLNYVSTIQIKEGADFSGFGLLEGIAITSSGEIIVTDIESDLIIKLNSFFEYERTIGSFGEAGLRDPLGVCVIQNGDIYVADSRNDRVVIFDSFGNFIRSLGEKILNNPAGVTMGQDLLIYVANTGENSIAVFDPEGNLIFEYGNLGAGMGNFNRPTDLKLGKDKLFVVDSGNNRIQVFEVLR